MTMAEYIPAPAMTQEQKRIKPAERKAEAIGKTLNLW